MSEEDLKLQIQSDEDELVRLSALEAELVDHVGRKAYTDATKREDVLSKMRILEERLHKNRQLFVSKARSV